MLWKFVEIMKKIVYTLKNFPEIVIVDEILHQLLQKLNEVLRNFSVYL